MNNKSTYKINDNILHGLYDQTKIEIKPISLKTVPISYTITLYSPYGKLNRPSR